MPWPQEGGTEVILGTHNGKAAGLGAALDVVHGAREGTRITAGFGA